MGPLGRRWPTGHHPASFLGVSYDPQDCAGGQHLGSYDAESNSGLKSNGPGGWHFNWKTPRDAKGTCAVVRLRLADEVSNGTTQFFVRFT